MSRPHLAELEIELIARELEARLGGAAEVLGLRIWGHPAMGLNDGQLSLLRVVAEMDNHLVLAFRDEADPSSPLRRLVVEAPSEVIADPRGLVIGSGEVIRWGNWRFVKRGDTLEMRRNLNASHRTERIGNQVALVLDVKTGEGEPSRDQTAAAAATALSSRGWTITALSLFQATYLQFGDGPLVVESASASGDSLSIRFRDIERPERTPELRIDSPRGFSMAESSLSAWRIETAARVAWLHYELFSVHGPAVEAW